MVVLSSQNLLHATEVVDQKDLQVVSCTRIASDALWACQAFCKMVSGICSALAENGKHAGKSGSQSVC